MSQAAAFPRKSPAEDSFSRRANDGDKPKAEKVAAVKFHGASVGKLQQLVGVSIVMGGTPKTLDGFCCGKSQSKWMMTGATPMTLETPICSSS